MPRPDKYLYQVRVQHPVGHGFFHSSTIRSEFRRFDYIVDCGGVSSAVARQIQAFKEGRDDRSLDLLMISHFHADHVSGLDSLLSDLRVMALAVPYLSPEAKLLCLATMSRKKREARNEQLVLRPHEWAQERGVKTIYIVHRDEDPPPEGILPLPELLRDSPRGTAQSEDPDGEWVLAPHGTSRLTLGIYALPHTKSLEVRSLQGVRWEFYFFCHTNPDLKLRIERSLVKKQWAPIRETLEVIRRGTPSNILSSATMRRHLREWHEFLVGDDLNLTSLSLLSVPLEHRVCSCYVAAQGQRAVSPSWSDWCWDNQKLGWLGTGDVMLKQSDLAEAFLERFGKIGLHRIACMSLSHHGSARNHSGKVLDRIDPTVTFVTCPLKENPHHPAPNVERAVRARGGRLTKVTELESSLLCEHVRILLD